MYVTCYCSMFASEEKLFGMTPHFYLGDEYWFRVGKQHICTVKLQQPTYWEIDQVFTNQKLRKQTESWKQTSHPIERPNHRPICSIMANTCTIYLTYNKILSHQST